MVVQNYQKVYSANGTLQAVTVQSELERAGIPAAVAHSQDGAYLDVMVPQARASEAHDLLFAEPPSGEAHWAPAE